MRHLIASHQARPSDDLIFALNGEATRRKAAGESVVNATLGTLMNDDGTLSLLDTAVKAVKAVPREEWAAYAPIAGTGDFLKAVIDDVLGGSPALKATAVAAATPGGSGALRHAIANYLEPGQSLLTTSFFWGPYQTLCDEQDRTLDTFPMFGADGGLDVAALEAKVEAHLAKQKRVLLFINDPCQNPTGYSMRDAEWKQVVEVLLRHAEKGPITLLVDMAYFLYGLAKDPRAFMQHLAPLLGKVGLLFAWSASKSFTHYGLRVGALIACVPDETERAMTSAAFSYSCRGVWSNCNRGGLAAVTKLLTDPALRSACDAERDALKATLMARVDAFNALARPKGLTYPRYEGGFFVTVFSSDAQALGSRMKERGVFAVPLKGAVRVALCSVAANDVARVVEALSAA
ncbi:MAG: aminotransferase class I/II-fold pyridoxal phosphate-dependent enzyme [Archangium sp.]|nr:aminotransferase class I/II-fold pyridoxal phosphate-dependent enzyme [Archangium sp.]